MYADTNMLVLTTISIVFLANGRLVLPRLVKTMAITDFEITAVMSDVNIDSFLFG